MVILLGDFLKESQEDASKLLLQSFMSNRRSEKEFLICISKAA